MGISSPLLRQAGFSKSKIVTAIKQHIYRLDGLTKHYQLSEPIEIFTGDVFELSFVAGGVSGDYARFFGARDYLFSLDTGEYGDKFRTINMAAKIDGEDIVRDSTLLPAAGVHVLSATYTRVGGEVFLHELASLNGGRLLPFPIFDFRIIRNGTVIHEIPLTNKDQGAFQLATTTPLGENLYTQEVIENPVSSGNQWTYLGDGRWQLIGDGSANSLQFLLTSQMPQSGYVQFEIESISGGTMSCSVGFVPDARFDTVGVKSYYYSDVSEPTAIQFKRSSGAINLVIKNIKHFDADGVLVAKIVNYTDSWEQI